MDRMEILSHFKLLSLLSKGAEGLGGINICIRGCMKQGEGVAETFQGNMMCA